MKIDKKDMLLYLVTDRTWLREEDLVEVVEETLRNNVTFVQLREKDLKYGKFKKLAIQIKKLTDRYKIPFVINDNIKIAMEVGADGLHVGQDDLDPESARKILGKDKILGVSVATVGQAVEAQRSGADYLGIGSIFPTKSKWDARKVEMKEVKEITRAVNIPTVGIGGINKENIHLLKGSGLDGIAVISAILAQKDVGLAAKNLYKLSKEVFSEGSNI